MSQASVSRIPGGLNVGKLTKAPLQVRKVAELLAPPEDVFAVIANHVERVHVWGVPCDDLFLETRAVPESHAFPEPGAFNDHATVFTCEADGDGRTILT
ncbi:MAG: hypothetical protein ACRDGN_04515 [bacterium]